MEYTDRRVREFKPAVAVVNRAKSILDAKSKNKAATQTFWIDSRVRLLLVLFSLFSHILLPAIRLLLLCHFVIAAYY
jgi:hypothetical protein